MAITFINKGTWAAGTTSIAPGIPASMAAGDFMILQVHTCNQAVTTPSGWTIVTSSPVSTGTAGAAGGTRVSVYYRWWQSGDAAPTVAVTGGTVTNGIIVGYRGVDPTTPFDATPVATTLATASTTLTMTGITTATANALIHWAIARDQDLNSTTAVTAFVNANLTGITETHDQVVNTGVGGGIWTGRGFKATAGATGNLTITQTTSIAVGLTIALRPKPNAYTLTGLGGAYTLTGGSATISRNRSLVASGGSYSLTGGSAIITWSAAPSGYTLTALGGSYSLIGGSATLSRNKKLVASGGNYSITGQSSVINKSKRIIATGGSYTITGQSANLLKSKRIVASGGSYTVTGQAVILLRNKVIQAQGGQYTITGQDAIITWASGPTQYLLTCTGGTYTLTASDSTVRRNRYLTASGGSYTVSGQAATILKSKYLVASGGSYIYSGQNAILARNRVLVAQSGTYNYQGSSASYSLVLAGGYPSPDTVLLGTIYGDTGQYVGTLDIGKKFRIDIATGHIVMIIGTDKVMTL